MAKKTFKKGLGSLIQDTRKSIEQDAQQDNEDNQHKNTEDKDSYTIRLMNQVGRLADELHLWRTGQLTVDGFKNSLAEHGLKYNEKSNKIEMKK